MEPSLIVEGRAGVDSSLLGVDVSEAEGRLSQFFSYWVDWP